MSQGLIPASLHVDGQLSAKTFRPPIGCISNAAVTGPIGATKLEHQHYLHLDQASTVTAETRLLHTVYGATAEVVSIKALTPTPATGDYTVTVDLKKGNTSGDFASILTSTLVLDSANAARTPESGTITSPDLVAGDVLQGTVAVAGTSGTQASGLLVSIVVREDAQ